MFKVILFTDVTDVVYLSKNIGPYVVANRLREAGYPTTVVSHLHMWTYAELTHYLSKIITAETLYVGINNFFYKLTNEQYSTTEDIRFEDPDVNLLFPQGHEFSKKIVAYIKSINPKCKIVLGGPNAQDSISNPLVDVVIKNYGDIACVELARALENNQKVPNTRRNMHGIEIIDGGTAAEFDFVNSHHVWQPEDGVWPGETLPIEISRGCIFKCKFCSYPLNGKKALDYIKNKTRLRQEFITNFEKFKVTRYYFLDDTFNDSIEKIQMIHEISQSLPFELEFWAYLRLDLIAANPDSLRTMHESGLRGTHFGIETLHKKSGSIIGKGGDPERMIDTLRWANQNFGHNLMLHASFIAGLPEEPVESILKVADRLTTGDIPLHSFHYFPLMIEQQNYRTDVSAFGLNLAEFGYEIKPDNKVTEIEKQLGQRRKLIAWKNRFIDFDGAIRLTQEIQSEAGPNMGMRSFSAFDIASLGMPLQDLIGLRMTQVPWHDLRQKKRQRFDWYRDRLTHCVVK